MDEHAFLSPEKRDALRKLREQKVALDKQSIAIQSALAKLDTAYVHHTTIGSSLYSSIVNRNYHSLHSARTLRNGSSDRTAALQSLHDKFVEQVEVTNSFQLPRPSQHATPRRLHVQDNNRVYDNKFARSNDETESYIGVDVLSHTRQQLHRIKEQRAATLAERLQQKQEALIAAEQARLDALHEVRHRAAMEVAGRHLVHRRCWVTVKRLFNHAKLRSNYTLAEYKWKVVSMMSVLNRLVRFVRMNSKSEGPYWALRQSAGWRQFCNNARRLAEEHLLDIQGELVAQSFREQRGCRRVLAELHRTVLRRRLTAAKIDHFNLCNAGRRALAAMKERLLGQHDQRVIRAGRVLRAELRRKSEAFAVLLHCALRGRRNRAIVVSDNTDKGTHALRCLKAFARRGAHLSHCMRDAEAFHAHHALSQALSAWHSSTTLRAHRRYCAGLAAAHSRDISRRTGSPWLRECVRGYLARWYERAERSHRRVQPLRQFHHKRNRQKVQAALREWRQKAVKARLKRRAERAKVRLLQLRRGWAWYQQQRGMLSERLRAHKAALLRSRDLLRSKNLADGFAEFRAYVLANREKRLAVKQQRHQRARANMAELFARLRQRLQTRNRRRSAAAARLQVLVRRGFRRWLTRAGLRLVAEGRARRRQLRAQRLGQGWMALGEAARARALRRSHTKKALLGAGRWRKYVALSAWASWSADRTARGVGYQAGRAAWRGSRLLAALQQWMAMTALTKQLAMSGVYRVRPSAARRRSFLHRWGDFLHDVRAKRDHQRSYSRDRENAQTRGFLRRLLDAVRSRADENHLLATYREHTLMPLLQSRFFMHMLRRRAEREERLSNPRLQYRERRCCRAALRTWRLFRKARLASARTLRLGDRNHQIVSCLQALTHWRNITRLHCTLVEAARQAARLYRRRYFAPAFKNWLRNTAALAHQFDARYLQHGDLLRRALARRVLAAFRRTHSLQRKLRRCAAAARTHTSTRSLRRGLDKLLTAAGRLRLLAAHKITARTHRAMELKRWVFRGFVQHTLLAKDQRAVVKTARARHNKRVLRIVFSAFQTILRESETPGFGRACRYEAKRSLRTALAVLRHRLVWRRTSRKSAHHLRHKLVQQGLVALRQCRQHRLHSKAVRNRVLVHFSAALCRRYLTRWISNRFSRRGPAVGARSSIVRTKSLADIWNLGAGGDRDSSARRRSASSVSTSSAAAPAGPSSARSPLRRQNSGALSVSIAAVPQGAGLGRARSLSIVRRRSSVNPVSFAQYRRRQQAVSALVAHTFRRRQEKEELLKVLKTMAAFQARACFAQWSAWVQDVVAEKLEAIHGDVHFERRLVAQVLPALRRLVRQRHRGHDAGDHHVKSLLSLGWRRWSKYACTGLRRAVAQARAQQRAREREAGKRAAPQYLDDDFSHCRSSVLGSPSSPPTVAAITEPRDHRVTVQRGRLRHAEVMHLLHAAVHALARWRHWSHTQHQHRRLVHACLHRQLESVFERLQQQAQRAKHRRAAQRTALHWRRHSLLRRSFAALTQHRQDSKVTRRLHGLVTGRIFRRWQRKVAFRGRTRQHLLALEDVYRASKLQAAFAEWRQDTAVEAALVQGLSDLRRHRLHHGVDHLIYNLKVRRRSAALQLRSRKFKTHRLLRKVFTNILAEMSVRYRSVEVLRECALYHLRYHCRRVLYNLFYLRRNRIAKDHNLALKFRGLVGALRVNRNVVRYHKANMGRANRVVLRKALWWLHRRAKQQKVASRRLRSLQPHRARAGVLHHSAALVHLSRRRALERALRRLGDYVGRRRKHRKQLRRCAYASMERPVRRCFRLLLSHCRRGSLRRRNSQALYALFVNLQLRRAVSRLDVNVSHRWASQQERRLMQAYSVARGKARALRLLGAYGLDSASAAVVRHALERGQAQGQDGQQGQDAIAPRLGRKQDHDDLAEGYTGTEGLEGLEESKEWIDADEYDTLLRSQ